MTARTSVPDTSLHVTVLAALALCTPLIPGPVIEMSAAPSSAWIVAERDYDDARERRLDRILVAAATHSAHQHYEQDHSQGGCEVSHGQTPQ